MYGVLSIYAKNHEKFKSLVISSMPNIFHIVLNAPTLNDFKYDGYVMKVMFLRECEVKEDIFFYKRNRRNYDLSDLLVANMIDYIKVHACPRNDKHLPRGTIFFE